MGALWTRRLRNRAGVMQSLRHLISGTLAPRQISIPKAAFISSLLWLLLWALLWPAVAHANSDGVSMRVREQAGGHFLFAHNRLDTPVTLKVQFSRTHNLAMSPRLQQPVLLPAKTEILLGKLTPKLKGAWRYQYNFTYQYGGQPGRLAKRYSAKPAAYAANKPASSRTSSRQNSALSMTYSHPAASTPYQSEKHDLASPVIGPYRIAQGFNGAFSHNKLANRYALDIALPVGTPLYASRAGVVVAAVDTHVGGGLAARYRGKANHLRVRHSDGSMTLYVHLQTDSLRVAKGDLVHIGQPIAASGNTGYTSGPHLHLALQINNSGMIESIPFTLQGSQPLAGLWLTGTAWGDE